MNRTLSILMESCKSCSKAESYECGEQCSQFEDTLKGMGKVDCTIPADAVPIQKCESCDKEEGCCKESYMIDFNILSVYTEDNSLPTVTSNRARRNLEKPLWEHI